MRLHIGGLKYIYIYKQNYLTVCNGKEIVSKDSVKYLGAILDQDMSGQSMGTTALKKVNKCLKFLYRKADFLDSKCRKMLCQALLQSHFDYSCNVWFRSLDKRLQNRLQCTQNKIIRYILKYDSRHHLECSDFAKLNFLNVSSRVDYLSCSMMSMQLIGYKPSRKDWE